MERQKFEPISADSIDALRDMDLPSGTAVSLKNLVIKEVKKTLHMIILDDNSEYPLTGFIEPKKFDSVRNGIRVNITGSYNYQKTLGSYTGKHPEIRPDLMEYIEMQEIELSD